MSGCPRWPSLLVLAVALLARADDCDQNGVEDAVDIVRGTALDCNQNGFPDACDLMPSSRPFVEGERLSDRRADWIALADLDGDGDDDAVLAGYGAGITVVLNQGDGTFAEPIHHELAGRVVAEPNAADMDGDGNLDVVLGDIDDSTFGTRVTILPGDGLGGLGEPISVALDTSPRNNVGDVDQDGDVDIVVTGGTRFLLLRNRGGAEFDTETLWTFDDQNLMNDAALFDLDGDGHLDLVASVRPDQLAMLRNQGDGTFTPPATTRTAEAPSWIEAADFDGDEDLDLLVARYVSVGDEEFSLFRNDAGSLQFQKLIPVPQRIFYPRLADLDADGDVDIVIAGDPDWDTPILILENAGDEEFRPAPELLRVPQRQPAPHRVVPFCAASPGSCGEMALLVAYYSESRRPHVLRRAPAARSEDCNGNAIPDECERDLRDCRDCNRNGVPDGSDIAAGTSPDENSNGVPDSCETSGPQFELRFDAPNWVQAPPGQTIVTPVGVEIHSLGYSAGTPGVRGWSLLVTADHARITDMTVEGTVAAPAPEGLFRNGFQRTGFPPSKSDPCPAQASTICVLDFNEPVSLEIAESPSKVLRLALETTAPAAGVNTVTLGFFLGACPGPAVLAPGDVPPGEGGGGSGGFLRPFVDVNGASDADVSFHEKRILVYARDPAFHRGDATDDGKLDISDPLRILNKLFLGGVTLGCRDAADANDDGRFNISDAISLFGFLFLGGPPPPAPGPPGDGAFCGPDSTRSAGDLGCEAYGSCL